MRNKRGGIDGIYIILDPSVCPDRSLTDVLKEAATAGARLFQYRNKSASMKEAYAEALLLRKVALDAGLTFIVNDRCDLALAVDADGVHLGQEDLPLDLARKVMGPDKLIGISTHNPDQVREPRPGNRTILASVRSSSPGPNTTTTRWWGLRGYVRCARSHRYPFAIGGIQIDQAGEVMRAGANGVAIISAILKARDISHAVKSFLAQMPGPTSLTS
jgi:thiamine-phosphate pyrophosphorylase